jgi:phosphoribosylaminoimidazole-succinocarboxamide synthase
MATVLLHSHIPGVRCRRGKVRDVYDLGDRLAIVATDRISAFDWVMPTGIPGKGRLLTAMTRYWFDRLGVRNHFLSDSIADLPAAFQPFSDDLIGRTMIVAKTTVVPIECVARGYLAGSGWKEYQVHGTVCGIRLPAGFRQSERLPAPIFTPATKAESGHDDNISFEAMADAVGMAMAESLRERTLAIYAQAAAHAERRGIILADTKFEFGTLPDGETILIDEILTPDSSRYWPRAEYVVGQSPPSFDKQFLRDWLEQVNWDKASPPPALPIEIVEQTAAKYAEAFERITAVTSDC